MYQNTYCIDIGMLRLVHLGTEYGVSRGYLRAMQAEVFGGNPDAFEHTTLIRVGEQLGIPAGEIRLSPPHGQAAPSQPGPRPGPGRGSSSR